MNSNTGRRQVGEDMAQVDNRSGRHDEPRAHTLYPASAGHKIPRSRVAYPSQIMVDAQASERLDSDLARRLQAAAEGDPYDPATYPRIKGRAHAGAVAAACRNDEPAGYLGGGARMGRPTDTLRTLFGIDGSTR